MIQFLLKFFEMKNKDRFSLIPTHTLVQTALEKRIAKKEYWDIVIALHERGTKTEFDEAKKLTISSDPILREMGADILGQLGYKTKKFLRPSEKILISLLEDGDYRVVSAAAIGLGHRFSKVAIPHLIRHMSHKSARARLGIVFGLLGQEDSQAIMALIHLSNDKSEKVRNWSTCGLGSMIETNSKEIRNALEKRLDEKNIEIKGEAILGLATRKHPGIVNLLKKELLGSEVNILYLDAAIALETNKLLPSLLDLKKRLTERDERIFTDRLNEAIEACQ